MSNPNPKTDHLKKFQVQGDCDRPLSQPQSFRLYQDQRNYIAAKGGVRYLRELIDRDMEPLIDE